MFDPDAKIQKASPEVLARMEEERQKKNSDPLSRLREEIDMIKLGESKDNISVRVM